MKIDLQFLIKQTFWIYFFTYFAIPLGFFIRILYARSFSLEEFGLIYSIIGLISLICIFNDVGFTETLNYYGTRFLEKKQYGKVKACILFALLMQFGSTIILLLLFFFLSPVLAEHYFKSEVAVSAFRFFLLFFASVNFLIVTQQIFKMTHNYFYESMITFVRMGAILILSLIILFIPSLKSVDYIGFVWGITCLLVAISFFAFAIRKFPEILRSKAKLSWNLYKKMFSYAIFVFLSANAAVLLSQTDVVVLTYFRNLSEVGLYSVALSIALVISSVIGPAISFIFPLTSKLSVSRDDESLTDLIMTMYNFGLFISLPILLIFVSFPREIILILFGESYLGGLLPLMVLSFAFFFSIFYSFNFAMISGLGLIRQKLKIMVIGAVMNVILDVILVMKLGMMGVAIGTLITMIFMLIMSYSLLSRRVSVSLNKPSLMKIIGLSAVTLGLIYILKNLLPFSALLEAAVILFVSGIFYLLAGYYMHLIDFDRIFSILRNSELAKFILRKKE